MVHLVFTLIYSIFHHILLWIYSIFCCEFIPYFIVKFIPYFVVNSFHILLWNLLWNLLYILLGNLLWNYSIFYCEFIPYFVISFYCERKFTIHWLLRIRYKFQVFVTTGINSLSLPKVIYDTIEINTTWNLIINTFLILNRIISWE